MFRYKMLPVALGLLLVLHGSAVVRRSIGPRLTLWAWERPEHLTFLDSHNVGVAFLAGSVYLDSSPVLRPRSQPLRVNPGTPLTAVVRIEITHETPATFTDAYRTEVVRQVLHLGDVPGVRELQVDFDARRSQRPFYRRLLEDLRAQSPVDRRLSITALGSWCLDDDWIAGLPVDEAVPMLFRMGMDEGNILHALSNGSDFRDPLCRTSVGLSTDEPWPQPLLDRNVFVFNTRAWNAQTVAAVQRGLQP
jgi:hypothetical protein